MSIGGRGLASVLVVLVLSGDVRGQEDPLSRFIVQSPPLTAAEQLKKFHLPPGFEIQLVAAEPEIRKPINISFDDAGRLLVTGSVEYPFPAKEGVTPRDTVQVLEDADGDGRAEKVSTLVDGLNIPIGVVAIRGGAIVYSIPNMLRVLDTDRDGQIDRREVLYGTFGFNDTHGMSNSYNAWIDGWIYGCHGFANTSTVQGRDAKPIVMQSGNTYRMRPNGGRIEYFTHGQVNPFGMAIDPLGNIFTSDCHTKPVYMLLRGAYYPSFGKPHDGLGFAPEMCKHSHGSTGIAGIVYYAADHFPDEYRGTLFIGNPITARINHDRLEARGSTYQAVEQPDFLSCDDPWFRPVDVRLGPDGALYVADFYNRIIGHYEVPLTHPLRDRERGRVWRIVYTGTDGKAAPPRRMPDLESETAAALVARLKDENLIVRIKATNQLVERIGPPAVDLVKSLLDNDGAANGAQRAHALWVLERLAGLDDDRVRKLAADPERLVRVHLLKALAERTPWPADNAPLAELVRSALKDPDPFVRRAAADALGRHPAAANLAPLLELWEAAPASDSQLVHTVRMAIRDQLLADGVFEQALAVFKDQAPRLGRLAEVSLGAPTPAAGAFLLTCLERDLVPRERWEECLKHTARYLAAEQLPAVLTLAARYESRPAGEQRMAVRALWRAHQERGAALPEPVQLWATRLAESFLSQDNADAAKQGLELAQELRLAEVHPQVARLAQTSKFPPLRLSAIDACVAIDAAGSVPLLSALVANGNDEMPLRQKAATALAGVNSDASRVELSKLLQAAPDQLAVAIASGLAASRPGAESLFDAVTAGKASARLLLDRNVSARLRQAGIDKIDERLAKLTAGLPPADERINKLIDARRTGFAKNASHDLTQGAKVFERVCAKCHQVGGKGAKIGPQLDGVGNRGLERIIEDLLDPSRNIDQAFRTTQVVTNAGRILTGLVLRTDGQVLVLADNEGKELRVPLSEIDEQVKTPLSPMPANVPELVKEDEFYQLLAYLLSQRQPPK